MIEYKVKVFDNGTRFWYVNDLLHREGGPAVEYAAGDRYWYLNGKCHREDGAAIERSNGNCFWYLNGVEVTKETVMNPAKELTVADIEKLLGHKVKIVK